MMFRQLAGNIEALQLADIKVIDETGTELLEDCKNIVDALQQYAGY